MHVSGRRRRTDKVTNLHDVDSGLMVTVVFWILRHGAVSDRDPVCEEYPIAFKALLSLSRTHRHIENDQQYWYDQWKQDWDRNFGSTI
jgi:hypothetical protein